MDIETIKKKYTKIIVWGCGKAFLNARTDDLEIAYIVDSDENKQGSVCKGIRVEKPEKILEEDMGKICILIFSVYWQSIVKDINSLKISAEIILPGLLNPNPFSGGGGRRHFLNMVRMPLYEGYRRNIGLT